MSAIYCHILVVLLGILVIPATYGQQQQQSDVKAVIVVYRHGDRTPVQPYPNDPYKNASYWPVGFGQLINEGKLRHYELGKWLRTRYGHLLPAQYSEDDIYVRSTDVDRTLMSAQANLAGLYEPVVKQQFKPGLLWQPIPVHSAPEKEDALLAMKKNCPKYDELYELQMQSEPFLTYQHLNHDLYAYLSLKSGSNITSLETMEYLYNTLTIEQSFNLTLPPWAETVLPKLRPWAFTSFVTQTFSRALARLKTGPFWHHVWQYLTVSGRSKPRMLMFSAHDTTIANLLNSLDLFEPHCPPYAATILLELTEKDAVRLWYKNGTEPRPLTLPVCGGGAFDCPLQEFLAGLRPLALSESQWRRECEEPQWTPTRVLLAFVVFAGLSLLVSLACLLACYLTAKCRKAVYVRLPDEDGYA